MRDLDTAVINALFAEGNIDTNNLLRNAGAEDQTLAPHVQVGTGTWAALSTAGRDGGWGFRFSSDGQTGTSYLFLNGLQSIPCGEGQTYHFIMWVRRAFGGGSSCYIRLRWYGGEGNHISDSSSDPAVPTTTWEQQTLTATAPAGATLLVPQLVVLNDGEVGALDFDDLFLGMYQPGATVGAPPGTNVGSTPAEDVEQGSNAAKNGLNPDGSVKPGKVGTDALADAAITTAKLANLAVDVNKLADLAVTASKLASGAVTDSKLADNAVTASKLAEAAVTTSKIANGAVDVNKLADLAVTASKLAGGAVTGPKIADNAVTASKLAEAAVTTSKIASGAVDSQRLANLAVEASKLADGAVTTTKIASAAVGSAAIAEGAIGTVHIGTAAILRGHIKDGEIVSAKIGTGQIDTVHIKNGAIGSAAIANLAVGTGHIANGAITNLKVANGAIQTAHIQDLAVETLKIADNAVTVPVSFYNAAEVTLPAAGASNWLTVASLTFTSSGGRVLLVFTGRFRSSGSTDWIDVRITRGGSQVFWPGAVNTPTTGQPLQAISFSELPPAGTHLYEVQCKHSAPAATCLVGVRSFFAMETKK